MVYCGRSIIIIIIVIVNIIIIIIIIIIVIIIIIIMININNIVTIIIVIIIILFSQFFTSFLRTLCTVHERSDKKGLHYCLSAGVLLPIDIIDGTNEKPKLEIHPLP